MSLPQFDAGGSNADSAAPRGEWPADIAALADDPGFLQRLDAFYRDIDAAIAGHFPVCVNRGLCCKFKSYGHRLYVTRVELAYFVAGQRAAGLRPVTSDDACPYQVAGQCTARDHRPLGCRIYFCDPNSQAWQGPEYERRLAELQAIGEEFGVRYAYREWLAALSETT